MSILFPKWPWLVFPPLAAAVATAFLTWAVAGYFHQKDIADLVREHEKALDKQELDLINACQQRQAITFGVDHGLQTAWAGIDGLLSNSLSNDTGPACIMPASATVGGGNEAPATGANVPATHGISSRWLKEIAAEADRLAVQLDACQQYIDKTWSLYGQ